MIVNEIAKFENRSTTLERLRVAELGQPRVVVGLAAAARPCRSCRTLR
jgi:hypothetical protein